MGQVFQYRCGCVNYMDPQWGVQRNERKCQYHSQAGGKGGLNHYIEMGAIVRGVPRHQHYWREMKAALDEIDVDLAADYGRWGRALEVGAGLGMYCPSLMKMGYSYIACEPDPEAAAWIRSTFDVQVEQVSFEELQWADDFFDLVVAAHVFEHMEDAPMGMAKVRRLLKPGGRLVLIVPNDEDPVNPDHLWFFNQRNLHLTLEATGFNDVRSVQKQIVKHEKFIYATGISRE